jgi:hypothetical protein
MLEVMLQRFNPRGYLRLDAIGVLSHLLSLHAAVMVR